MTRETKIGLLVGLAFIIVIGILLSDHLTQTNEPQGAQLAQVADSVRGGVTTPGGHQTAGGQQVAQPTQPVAPQQQIPSRQELAPTKPPVEIVQIGPGQQNPDQPAQPKQPDAPTVIAQGPGVTRPDAPIISQEPAQPTPTHPRGVSGALNSIAQTMGEEVVPVGPESAKPQQQQPSSPKSEPIVSLPAGSRQYKAEAGDSVSRIAARLMGADTKSNRDALIAANPTLQANPNLVVAGRSYVIPGAASQQPKQPASPSTPAIDPAAISGTTPPPAKVAVIDKPATASPQYFYTVKPGDTLTRIAMMQLGNSAAVNAIIDLNQDVLKGKDTIRPNMKLRLPAKPVASAQ